MATDVNPLLLCVTAACAVLAIIALRRRYILGNSFTATGGLHTNVLCFIGLGPFIAYSSSHDTTSPSMSVMDHTTATAIWLAYGYAIVVALELWHSRGKRPRPAASRRPRIRVGELALLACAGLLGYWGANLDIATAGLGTIFPVLKGFFYPAVMLAAYRCGFSSALEFAVSALVLASAGVLTFFSPWRSEMILVSVAVTMGVIAQAPRLRYAVAALGVAAVLVTLPFQQLKRTNYLAFMESPAEAFVTSQHATLADRIDLLQSFCAVRLNYVREMAFVGSAVDQSLIQRRNGASYVEAIEQLVPRVFWSSKPSFNQTSGYDLPRRIGLVNRDDTGTSWAVDAFAEFIWNYDARWLILFTPLLFGFCQALDRLTLRVARDPSSVWILNGALFFQMFALVSVVNATTYILWTFALVALRSGVVAQSRRRGAHKRLAARQPPAATVPMRAMS